MPLNPHASVGTNIKEFRTGPTYRHTEEEYGKKDADAQALAVALHTQDKAHHAKRRDREEEDLDHYMPRREH